jgi:hypothetical protein
MSKVIQNEHLQFFKDLAELCKKYKVSIACNDTLFSIDSTGYVSFSFNYSSIIYKAPYFNARTETVTVDETIAIAERTSL